MSPEESFRLIAFALALSAVYAAAISFAFRRWVLRKPRNESPTRRHVERAAYVLAGLGVLCFSYGLWVEPYWPEVTHARIPSSKIRSRIRIVHLSDIHSDPAPRLEERLPGLVREQQPDLIVFTGDSLNSPAGLPVFRACLTKLAAIAPTVVVRGNWDTWYWGELDLFGGTGARELVNSSLGLSMRGETVWLGGFDVDNGLALAPLMAAAPREALRVLLHHYPDEIYEASKRGVDLYLAGHTHGGQVALPFYGALVTFSRFGKRFERGLHRVGDTWLYVNRGIGMEGGTAPRVRFLARPEITVIDVEPVEINAGRRRP